MIPKRIEGTTRTLGAPANWDAERNGPCSGLAIADVAVDLGDGRQGNIMFSAWEPTPDELRLLNAGGQLVLGVHGTGHPPIQLFVQAAPDAS